MFIILLTILCSFSKIISEMPTLILMNFDRYLKLNNSNILKHDQLLDK